MYKNLSSEIENAGICLTDICWQLGILETELQEKISGHAEFSFREAVRIRDLFFCHLTLEHLFALSKEQEVAKQRE